MSPTTTSWTACVTSSYDLLAHPDFTSRYRWTTTPPQQQPRLQAHSSLQTPPLRPAKIARTTSSFPQPSSSSSSTNLQQTLNPSNAVPPNSKSPGKSVTTLLLPNSSTSSA